MAQTNLIKIIDRTYIIITNKWFIRDFSLGVLIKYNRFSSRKSGNLYILTIKTYYIIK